NLDLLQSRGLFDLARWITLVSGIHDVDPDRQSQFVPERASIDFLWLIEPCPYGTSEIGIVSRKERIREIVGGPGFSSGRKLLQAKLCISSFSCSRFKRIHKARMHFVRSLGFRYDFPNALLLPVPNDCSVFFLYSLQNMRCAGSPAAIGKNRVSHR